ncbi:MAG: hypothetical protein PHG16_04740 [Lachnospiraceae bacterium]|nr:hypothetical protein [Lachnospiraceae bacterium]
MAEEKLLAYIEKLYETAKKIEKKLQRESIGSKEVKKLSGTDFEDIVYDSLLETGFEKEEITHSAQKFPDFIIEDPEEGYKIGVEVKKTDAARWEVIGGSIYESLKNDIEDTYVLMAKLGGDKPEVRLKKYEECIADLKVTHSPRFYLNLNLEEGEDYLTQNDAKDLLELSGDELNRKIRQLLRTQKSTWWSEGETIAFSDLTKEEKGSYLNEGIALFPEVFNSNYQKFTPWLVYSCFVWCGNVRDIFSAGGNVFDEELHIYISAIMNRTLENIESIRRRIIEMTEEEQLKFWGRATNNRDERLGNWLELVKGNLKCSSDLIKNNKTLLLYENYGGEKISASVKSKFMSRLSCKMM